MEEEEYSESNSTVGPNHFRVFDRSGEKRDFF